MKNVILIMCCALLVSFTSCNKKVKKESVEATEVVTSKPSDDVTATVKNDKGETLKVKFDKVAGTAEMEFKGEKFTLKQDTMASGIKYSNDKYVYSEWHGEITLKKDGQTIFEKK